MTVSNVVRLAIVTPVHNRRETTLRCLRCLYAAEREGPDFTLSLEIVVVDDGSTDGSSAAIAAEFPDVTLLAGDGNLLYAGGVNLGLRHIRSTGAQLVLIMNDDTFIQREALVELAKCLRANPNAIVGAVLAIDGTDELFQVDPRWETAYGGWHHHRGIRVRDVPAGPFSVQTIVGNCYLSEAETLRDRYLPTGCGYGDVEFVAALRRSGVSALICSAAIVDCEANTLPPPLSTLRR